MYFTKMWITATTLEEGFLHFHRDRNIPCNMLSTTKVCIKSKQYFCSTSSESYSRRLTIKNNSKPLVINNTKMKLKLKINPLIISLGKKICFGLTPKESQVGTR